MCNVDDLKKSIHFGVMKWTVVVHCINRSSYPKLELTCFKLIVLLAPACVLVGLHKTEETRPDFKQATCGVIVVLTRELTHVNPVVCMLV